MSGRPERLPERLLEVEAAIREVVTRAQLEGRQPRAEEVEPLRRSLSDAFERWCTGVVGELERVCTAISSAIQSLEELEGVLQPPTGAVTGRERKLREVDSILNEVEERVSEVTGRPCRWSKHLGEARLKPTMLLNDVAACVHVLAQHMAERWPEREEGKCLIAKSASEDAVRVCREWDAVTDFLREREVYAPEDAEALRGYAVGRRVQFRVGSAPGHLAEIDLERGVLNYYDDDGEVNVGMMKLLAWYARARCEHVEGEGAGVSVPSLTCRLGDPVRAARALALATSMDIRIGERKQSVLEEEERTCVREILEERLREYLEP